MLPRTSRRRALTTLALAPLALAAACAPSQAEPPGPATARPAAGAGAVGQPSQPTTTPAPAPARPATQAPAQAGSKAVRDLVWWITSAGLMEQLAAEYGERNGIAISAQIQGNYDQMVQKVQAGIAAGSLPHVAVLGQRHGIPQIADSGRLIPLAELIKADPSFGEHDFLPAFWKKFTYKGQIQTTPFINSSPVLHYNRTAFAEAGLNPDEPPATWEQLVAAARALTRRDGSNVGQWGLNTAADTPWYAYALIWQNGGSVLSDEGRPAFNQEAGLGALQFWKDLVHTHRVMPPLQHADAEKDFVAGKVAMLFASSASTGGFERDIGGRFDYGVARFPGHKQRAVPVGGASLGIFRSDPEHEAAAWGFVKWLTSPETNARISRETGYVAIRNATLERPEVRELLAQNQRRAVAIQQVREDIRAEGVSPADAVVWLGLEKVQQRLEAEPDVEPKRLLDELAIEAEKYLSEY